MIGRDQPEVITRAQPDTIDLLEVLQEAWRSICSTYDVNAELPGTHCLFEGADLQMPQQAAETIVANMLLEAIDEVGRFSPAYRQPIGLIQVRDRAANRSRWLLAPETRERWQRVIHALSLAIEKNLGMLLAADVLGAFATSESCDESRGMACCLCAPPRVILVKRSVVCNANIVCETCQQPFHLIDAQDED